MIKKNIFKNMPGALRNGIFIHQTDAFYYIGGSCFVLRMSDKNTYDYIIEKVLSYKNHAEPKEVKLSRFDDLFSLPETSIVVAECEKIVFDKKECLVTSDKWMFNTKYMLVDEELLKKKEELERFADHFKEPDVKTVIRENDKKQHVLTQHGRGVDFALLPIRRK